MQVLSSNDIEQKLVDMEGAKGCKVQILVGKNCSAPNFVMRQFTVDPGGYTPKHFHDYEHEVFVLEGTGQVLDGDDWKDLNPGDVVYVSPNDIHQFKNPGSSALKFLCLIPNSALDKQVNVVPECGTE